MDYTTLAPAPIALDTQRQEALVPLSSLYEALQLMPDPRRGQGKRYPLALLLCLLLLAKLAGQTTLSGATEWLRHRAGTIAEQFGLQRRQMPCQIRSASSQASRSNYVT
jgi:DDE_Tnp_1-associated